MPIALLICGIASILYGVCIMMIRSGTWFFAFWYALGAVLLCAAWAVHTGWWAALPAAVRRVSYAVMGILLAGFLATQACVFKDFNDQADDGLDYLIVLGAQVREDGPSTVLQYRLDAAYDYLVRNDDTTCIVSGGQGLNEHTAEANVMASYLIDRGIDPSRIILEDQSLDTSQNIKFSSRLFDPETESVAIVTNNFHVFRGVALARKAGYAHVTGLSAYSNPLYLPNNLTRESLGIAKDFISGNL